MKIVLVWNSPYPLNMSSPPYASYRKGFTNLGHEVVTLCWAEAKVEGYPYPVVYFQSEQELLNPGYWSRLGCSLAVLFTWHRMTSVLQAIRSSGMKVLNIGDSDGRISIRHHPLQTYRLATCMQPTLWKKIAATRYWGTRWLFRSTTEEKAIVDNFMASDALALGGEGAILEFRKIIPAGMDPRALPKMACVYYPAADDFIEAPLSSARPNRIIAIGRWDSFQKNPDLLARSLDLVLEQKPGAHCIIAGKDDLGIIKTLVQKRPSIQYVGVISQQEITSIMCQSQMLLNTSRWEGGPVSAMEALAVGCTLVGTPLPILKAITEDGQFGRASETHSPYAVAQAVMEEMQAWDSGKRDPGAIAKHWRGLVSSTAVAEQMLKAVNLA